MISCAARNTDQMCRDSSVKLSFTLISDSSFSNRHSLRIMWSKAQDIPLLTPPVQIDCISSPKSQIFTMISVSTPDSKQSEAYIATVALFLLFSSSAKEDKVFLRLPPAWRDLWTEFAEAKKEKGKGQGDSKGGKAGGKGGGAATAVVASQGRATLCGKCARRAPLHHRI